MIQNLILIFSIFLFSCSHSLQTKHSFHKPKNWYVKFDVKKDQKTSKGKQELAFYKPKNWKTQSNIETTVQPDTEFTPDENQLIGFSSWYGPGFHGKKTANGETYNQYALTAAHKILPIGSVVRVNNLENGKTVVVRINDRGPYKKNRILDLSKTAAAKLGFLQKGTSKVKIDVIRYPDSYEPEKGLDPYRQSVVQLAAFSSKERANFYLKQLSKRFDDIKLFVDNQDSSFHVVSGPFKRKDAAKEVALNLKNEGLDNFVRSYRK